MLFSPILRALSLGAGVQSTALALMAAPSPQADPAMTRSLP